MYINRIIIAIDHDKEVWWYQYGIHIFLMSKMNMVDTLEVKKNEHRINFHSMVNKPILIGCVWFNQLRI